MSSSCSGWPFDDEWGFSRHELRSTKANEVKALGMLTAVATLSVPRLYAMAFVEGHVYHVY